ncbi:hypothetical protein CUT44_26045 [Streptomyces carminius]|uniref:Uncharacterized protein n=1 Tax=Streptomyces carminius TaxID=2665496 RepID=A0A2M8LT24_9ACTN|nr:hypothetical protein [Streptomyces carminius]PJE95108.1 hypothetical protein CUT44_26045 [Streptomyces carminius]
MAVQGHSHHRPGLHLPSWRRTRAAAPAAGARAAAGQETGTTTDATVALAAYGAGRTWEALPLVKRHGWLR